jgi:PAS domain S-box-containing protein
MTAPAERPRSGFRRGLHWRLSLPTAVLIAGMLFAQGSYFAMEQTALASELLREQGKSLARSLAASTINALLRRDIEVIEQVALQLVAQKDFRSLQMLDADGRMLVDIDRDGGKAAVRYGRAAPLPPSDEGLQPAADHASPWRYLRGEEQDPVIWESIRGADGSLLGWIRFSLDITPVNTLQDSIRERHLALLALGILAAVLAVFMIMRRPLAEMRRATGFARGLAESQGEQAEGYAAVSEIDQLFRSLNEASTNLAARDAALRDARSFLESLADTIGEGVYATDNDGHCLFVNAAALALSGYSREEVLGADVCGIFHGMRSGQGSCEQICARTIALETQRQFRTEDAVFRRKDGSLFPVRVVASPLLESGIRTGAVVVFGDISERKQIEQAILAAKEEAEEANLVKSRFLSTISHELRTPMNGILGMTQIALMKNPAPEQQRYLGSILESARGLLGIIENLIAYSVADSGLPAASPADFDVAEMLQRIASNVAPLASAKGLELREEIAGEVPRKLVGDPIGLARVLALYADNAIKFSSSGDIVLRVMLLQREAGSVLLRFEVEDSGIGIEAASQAMLFRPFQQGDMSDSRSYGGMGLGLALARQLVQRMNGSVGVDTVPGRGSRFWFDVKLGIAAQ